MDQGTDVCRTLRTTVLTGQGFGVQSLLLLFTIPVPVHDSALETEKVKVGTGVKFPDWLKSGLSIGIKRVDPNLPLVHS